ncbi:MAG: thioredoxin family protein [Ignavibacteria bacterium]|nr:thioredoxin family protein [Ignavibacteria bacterium]
MSVIKSTDADFQNLIATNEKVIVKFFADWCGTCQLLTPKFKRLSEDPEYKDITFLEIDTEENQETRKFAGVDKLPFFATYKNGVLFEDKVTAMEEKVIILLKNLE